MNLFTISWQYLKAKPLSFILSLVLVALGVSLASILFLFNYQFQDRLYKNIADVDLVVSAKGSPLQMILSSVYQIDAPTGNIPLKDGPLVTKNPFVERAIPLALGDSYKMHRIVGTDHLYVEHFKAELASGKLWDKDLEVTIGAEVARRLGLKIGDKFMGSHGVDIDDDMHVHEDMEYTVVGVLAPNNTVVDQVILTNVSSIWRMHPPEDEHDDDHHEHHDHPQDSTHAHHDHHGHAHHEGDELEPISSEGKDVTAYLVTYKRIKNDKGLMIPAPMASFKVPEIISEHSEAMGYAVPVRELKRLEEMMGVGTGALQVLALLLVLVSAFSVFISLYNALKERRYELALMRSMGASRGKILSLILLEGLIIGLLGAALGLFISHLGMELFAGYLQNAYQYKFTGWLFLTEEIFLVLGSLFIGLVAALIPAIQAYNTDIHETLSQS